MPQPLRPISGPFSGFHLAFVDATRIALNHQLGTRTHPIVNTAVLGAFARVLGMPPLEAVVRAIEEEVPRKPEENIQAAQEAYGRCGDSTWRRNHDG